MASCNGLPFFISPYLSEGGVCMGMFLVVGLILRSEVGRLRRAGCWVFQDINSWNNPFIKGFYKYLIKENPVR